MAVAIRRENISILEDTNTFTGPGKFKLQLVAGSDAATLTVSIGSDEVISLAAVTGDTVHSGCIRVGSVELTAAITGTAAKAYVIWE